jgi:hypothetical protein
MFTAEECRKYAQECIAWGKTAKREQDRKALLEMARMWGEAATMADSGRSNKAEHLPTLKRPQPSAE